MSEEQGRVVVGGASGFMGRAIVAHQRSRGREVVTIGRAGADVSWNDTAEIARAVDGAALVIGLAGKSVNCRYTRANRAEIFRSRLDTTRALREAIAHAVQPPPVWMNASTATIYRHAMDRAQTESSGEIGTGFSVEVARAWEREFFAGDLPATRRIALRTAIVLGDGGVVETLARLTRLGLGGTNLDGRWPVSTRRRAAGTAHLPGSRKGRQRFSWIHLDDVIGSIDFLEARADLAGPINLAAPNPADNRTLMREMRSLLGVPVGLPMPRWMSELGAVMIRTETELILKSRWVSPTRLDDAGYRFARPELAPALAASLPKRAA